MDDQEYERIARYLYEENVGRKLLLASSRRPAPPLQSDSRQAIGELISALRSIRYLLDATEIDADVRRQFMPDLLVSVSDKVRNGTEYSNTLLRESGIVEALESNFSEIIDGLSVDRLPPEDFEALRLSGSSDPRAELQLLVSRLRSHKQELAFARDSNGVVIPLDHRLNEAVKIIDNGRQALQAPEQPAKRNWFKGLGKICQGSLLSITNVSVAAAGVLAGPAVQAVALAAPLAAVSIGVSLMTSVGTGVGALLEGVGELKSG